MNQPTNFDWQMMGCMAGGMVIGAALGLAAVWLVTAYVDALVAEAVRGGMDAYMEAIDEDIRNALERYEE